MRMKPGVMNTKSVRMIMRQPAIVQGEFKFLNVTLMPVEPLVASGDNQDLY